VSCKPADAYRRGANVLYNWYRCGQPVEHWGWGPLPGVPWRLPPNIPNDGRMAPICPHQPVEVTAYFRQRLAQAEAEEAAVRGARPHTAVGAQAEGT
jgi:hypothetical protein